MFNISINELAKKLTNNFANAIMVDFYGNVEINNKSNLPSTSKEMFKTYSYHDKRPFFKVDNYSRQNNMPIYTNLLRQRLQSNKIAGESKYNFEIFACQKGVIFKNDYLKSFSVGLHDINGEYQDFNLYLAHFKFNHVFQNKVFEENIRKQHWDNSKEYEIYLKNLKTFLNPFDKNYSIDFNHENFYEQMLSLK